MVRFHKILVEKQIFDRVAESVAWVGKIPLGIDFSKFLKQIDYTEAIRRYDSDSEAAGEVPEAPEGAGEDRPGEAAER